MIMSCSDDTVLNELIEELKNNPIDCTSFARPDFCKLTHIDWNVQVNFENKILEGFVDLTYEKQNQSVKQIFLDANDLTIISVEDTIFKTNLDYSLSSVVKVFGSKLAITLDVRPSKSSIIRIRYKTSHTASALQWLTPEQTAGKERPYLFSQCEAIHCRSMLPLQDTPAVKTTYSARVRAPKDLVVLLSAVREEGKTESENENGDDLKEYSFIQKIPIPSYLFAIVVGKLESRRIGPRTHVWSEKEFFDNAAYEFADTEKMLKFAEELFGPYVWGIYDILVLPPSFPLGGMENPCLTFITPTVLAGDRSLVDVISHEISHSWTGNLVTNRNFEHHWLNEGFTMFAQRKIEGKLYSGEKYRQFSAIIGLNALEEAIKVQGKTNPLTKLVKDLRGVDPDDAFSLVQYEKGHTFLFYLEEILGGPAVFEPFLKAYIEKFKYKSIDSNDFRAYLYEFFAQKKDLLNKVDWNSWFYATGMPIVIPEYDTSMIDASNSLAEKWIKATHSQLQEFKHADIEKLNGYQINQMLVKLVDSEEVIDEIKIKALVDVYKLRSTENAEVRVAWLRLGLRAHWKDCIENAITFATSQGRMRYVRPIFRELYAWLETRQLAIETYHKHKNEWMHITIKAVTKELHFNN